MRDRVGEEFEGSVSAVTIFGIFVALDDSREGTGAYSESGRTIPLRRNPSPIGRGPHPEQFRLAAG